MTAAQAFAEILDREHDAARRADVGSLLELQDAKREAMKRLRSESLSATEHDSLARHARANIAVIRHLVACMRGLASIGAADTYTPTGQRSEAAVGQLRGTL